MVAEAISPEDYDAAAAREPATCPLLYLGGDDRPGRRLLQDLPGDRSVAQGRRWRGAGLAIVFLDEARLQEAFAGDCACL
jgi:hypothetical protein